MNEDSYREKLVDNILKLVYPHITETMKIIKRADLKDYSIDELCELKKSLLKENEKRIFQAQPEHLYRDDLLKTFWENQKNILIDSCMSLVFPFLHDIQKPMVRKQFENKSIEELVDIERLYLQELKEKGPKF